MRYPDVPIPVGGGGALAYAHDPITNPSGFAWVYAVVGNGTHDFFKYGPVSFPTGGGGRGTRDIPRWRACAPTPDYAATDPGAGLAWATEGTDEFDSIFLMPCQVYYSYYVFAYNRATDAWSPSLDLLPDQPGPGSALCATNQSSQSILHCLMGDQLAGSDRRASYRTLSTIPPSEWKRYDNIDTDLRDGAALASAHYTSYVYAFCGGGTTDFYRHFILDDEVGGGAQSGRLGTNAVQFAAANPNPMTDRTTIRFTTSQPGPHVVTVYSPTGVRVKTLLDRNIPTGEHLLEWDRTDDSGHETPGGVYLLRVQGPGLLPSSKLVVR